MKAQGRGLKLIWRACVFPLFVSICGHQSHTAEKAWGLHRPHLLRCWFPLNCGRRWPCFSHRGQGKAKEAECQPEPSDHICFLDRLYLSWCCLRVRTFPGPVPPPVPIHMKGECLLSSVGSSTGQRAHDHASPVPHLTPGGDWCYLGRECIDKTHRTEFGLPTLLLRLLFMAI